MLVGCVVKNQVNVIVFEFFLLVYVDVEGYEDRFQNIYVKFFDYLVMCSENCYLVLLFIECDLLMQDCLYIGEKCDVIMDVGFSVIWLGYVSFYVQIVVG